MKNYLTGFAALVILFFIGYHFWTAVSFDNIKYIKIANQEIKVELALTSEQKEKGLGGRSELGEDTGMLFIFEKPGKYSFWMKDMNFPIDIIWFDENLKVIYIQKNAMPESYPETYGPNENAKYVLEVVAGFADKNNLQLGDSVLFTY